MRCCQFTMWVLIILSIILQICSGCLIEEKRALLDFKAYFNLPKDDHLVLPSWIDDQEEQYNNHSANDCCNWERVTCSNTTGRIVELHLSRILVKSCQTYLNQYRYPPQLLNLSIFLPMSNLQKLALSNDFGLLDIFPGCEHADRFGAPEIAGCEHADRFENLEYLSMNWNDFNNSIIPCVTAIPSLKYLSLSGSDFTEGLFPTEEFNRLKQLEYLDLEYSGFSGSLSFKEFKLQNLKVLNLKGLPINELSSIETMTSLTALSLSRMGINGSAILEGTLALTISDVQEEVAFTTKSRTDTYAGIILNYLSGIDLSCNQLTGEMPLAIGNLIDLRALNLSHNHLQGSIISTLSMLNLMDSLDLSYNNFSGQIPTQLNNMTSLGTFNVSYNNLSGVIPETRQFWTFDESSYRRNPNLCGSLLKKSCNRITTDVVHATDGEETDGAVDMAAFLWSFSAGFAAVLSALALSLSISPQYRRAWFGFIDTWILSRFYHRFKFHLKLS